MRNIREMLRLKAMGYSIRQIARHCGCAFGTVWNVIHRAEIAKITWPLPEEIKDAELEAIIYPAIHSKPKAEQPDWAEIGRQLAQYKHMTLAVLWQEYRRENPKGLSYSQFCERFRRWRKNSEVTLRQVYKAGEKMFVDWAGDTIGYVAAGERKKAFLFVAVLGYSNYTYAELCPCQDLANWIGAHVRAMAFFGGAPEVVVPDNLKTGVITPDRYEPALQETYRELAAHYGMVILPARAKKPRDKAKVEVGVQVAERWLLAPLLKYTDFDWPELVKALAEQLDALNKKPLTGRFESRFELWQALERQALKPLPETPYELAVWRKARVPADYHIDFDGNSYSVPYTLVGQTVEVRATAAVVEIFYSGDRIASHPRCTGVREQLTVPEHRPEAHRAVLSQTPENILARAALVGPHTLRLCRAIMAERRHPEAGVRSCLGILKIASQYGFRRLEAAAEKALAGKIFAYRQIEAIIKSLPEETRLHANLRGAQYFGASKGVLPC